MKALGEGVGKVEEIPPLARDFDPENAAADAGDGACGLDGVEGEPFHFETILAARYDDFADPAGQPADPAGQPADPAGQPVALVPVLGRDVDVDGEPGPVVHGVSGVGERGVSFPGRGGKVLRFDL